VSTTTTVGRVGLNALFLVPGESGGPETYLRELVPALVSGNPATSFTLVTTGSGAAALGRDGWADLLEIRALGAEGNRGGRLLAEQLLLPRLARRERWDVLHSLATLAPVVPATRSVVTLHDVTFFEHRTFGRATPAAMRFLTARAARRADALITVSQASREQIVRVLDVEAQRIDVVPQGLGRTRAPEPPSESELRERFALAGARVVLCVAAKRPHKNQELLIRALPLLPQDVVLVLAGHAEPYEQTLRELAAQTGVAERVRFPGYVGDGELEGLWKLASCVGFPSLAEGFGMPILEAMQRAVPVACSDIAVLHEVGGDAALYFDPRDPAGAARQIEAAFDSERLRQLGPQRAAGFTWEKTAHGTFEAYERAMRAR
jgi:glycosyltransferase involved in cell wall biosynthesis